MNEKKQLRRDISLLGVFCIATGAMISSGLFILPGIASAKVGPALFLSYILASLFALPTVLSQAELTQPCLKQEEIISLLHGVWAS